MAYADFNYYQNMYKGRVFTAAADFDSYAEAASRKMDNGCNPGLEEIATLDVVKACCCHMAEEQKQDDDVQAGGGVVASETRGRVSRTYATGASRRATVPVETRLWDIMAEYLDTWGVLYRGR